MRSFILLEELEIECILLIIVTIPLLCCCDEVLAWKNTTAASLCVSTLTKSCHWQSYSICYSDPQSHDELGSPFFIRTIELNCAQKGSLLACQST